VRFSLLTGEHYYRKNKTTGTSRSPSMDAGLHSGCGSDLASHPGKKEIFVVFTPKDVVESLFSNEI
jgi:hypothetical protein